MYEIPFEILKFWRKFLLLFFLCFRFCFCLGSAQLLPRKHEIQISFSLSVLVKQHILNHLPKDYYCGKIISTGSTLYHPKKGVDKCGRNVAVTEIHFKITINLLIMFLSGNTAYVNAYIVNRQRIGITLHTSSYTSELWVVCSPGAPSQLIFSVLGKIFPNCIILHENWGTYSIFTLCVKLSFMSVGIQSIAWGLYISLSACKKHLLL